MWGKTKRAFAAFEMYMEALVAFPAIALGGFGIVAERGKSDSGGAVLVGLAFVAGGLWATYKTLGRLGWIARG
jgi:hypothetical protein